MDDGCAAPGVVHTVGHSTREIDAFLARLAAHAIGCVVDVRRWPASRRYPHFAREALASSLAGAGIAYVWRADLGGYRKAAPDSPNTGWRVAAFRAYADYMLTPAFDRAIGEVGALADARRVAVMCAEAVPWRCHRQLVADALTVRGRAVRHILDTGRPRDHGVQTATRSPRDAGGCSPHALTAFARPDGARILYPADGQLRLADAGRASGA